MSSSQPFLPLCMNRRQKIILSGCHLKLHGVSSPAGKIRFSKLTMNQVVFLTSDLSIAVPNQAVHMGKLATAEISSKHSQKKYSFCRS